MRDGGESSGEAEDAAVEALEARLARLSDAIASAQAEAGVAEAAAAEAKVTVEVAAADEAAAKARAAAEAAAAATSSFDHMSAMDILTLEDDFGSDSPFATGASPAASPAEADRSSAEGTGHARERRPSER